MLCKKAVYNGLRFQVYTHLVLFCCFLTLMYQMLADKETYFEIHDHL